MMQMWGHYILSKIAQDAILVPAFLEGLCRVHRPAEEGKIRCGKEGRGGRRETQSSRGR
mgnify:FL=1